jgi:release factor glutamine methyltransferase
LRTGELFEPLSGRYEYLCANPPYISDAEWAELAPNVRDHEPTHALYGGPDGLSVLRPLILGAARHLADPGQLVVEIAASQKREALDLAEQAEGLTNPRVLADAEGHPRVLVADR